MFPFNLPGPQFLLFYVLFAAAVIATFYFGRRRSELDQPPSIPLQDPYLFACLRGGPKEVACVATLALIDRGLLQAKDRVVTRSPESTPDLVRRRVEKEVLNHFEGQAPLDTVTSQSAILHAATQDYEEELRRHGLLPDASMQRKRFLFVAVAMMTLVAVGGIKLLLALGAGRANVLLLIAMMVAALAIVWKLRNPYRSAAGDANLASIRSVFSDLRKRASSIRPGSGSRELLWLTALFGVAALPATAFPAVKYFRSKPASYASSGCGSSCGSGASSGCGGGGGGGGCGGCGS
jgi:uncharacterized protein (TIGR04222 family)